MSPVFKNEFVITLQFDQHVRIVSGMPVPERMMMCAFYNGECIKLHIAKMVYYFINTFFAGSYIRNFVQKLRMKRKVSRFCF